MVNCGFMKIQLIEISLLSFYWSWCFGSSFFIFVEILNISSSLNFFLTTV